jgi:RHS repeat-associated protein
LDKSLAVNEADTEIKAAAAAATAAASTNTTNTANSQVSSIIIGDPVLATTGSYLLETEDYGITGTGFAISRKYISEDETAGSMGSAWLLSLDSRIMRGVTPVNSGKLNEMEALVGGMLEAYQGIDKQYASDIAEEVYGMYLSAKSKVDELHKITALSVDLALLNQFCKFRGTPSHYEGVGNNNLVVIDENGTPRVFEPAGSGVWLPINYPERLYERLESLDGNGVQSRAGFVLNTKGGRKKLYDGYGMLTGVIELNGNSVEITRDLEERITSIRGPHGTEWTPVYNGDYISGIKGPGGMELRYGYNGDKLAWAEDYEGDRIRYAYEEGRLKDIVKPDNSFIRLTYGYRGADGKLLVTATTHEEGASENFDYDPAQRLTTYTSHSGVISRYWYDGSHRTVREEHGDGSVRTFAYNDWGQLERETLNGFETVYRYDGRGNIAEKLYSDGKRETWQWSGNDQMTRYADRDGVVVEFVYDNHWNCIEVRRGGLVIFIAGYDGKNRLVTSREGDRSEIRYEYDSRDHISAKSAVINGIEIKEKWEYDALGRIVKYTDGLGRQWEYTYGPGETTEKNPMGLEKRYEYNNRKDLVRVIEKDLKTGEEREKRYTYDKRHLLLEAVDGAGNVTNYAYRADGGLVREERGSWFLEYGYDAGGRINTITRGKTGTNERYTERYDYTLQGWNEVWTATKPGAGSTVYRLDAFGVVTGVTNALGESSVRTLNGAGNALTEQAVSGGFLVYRYDSQGRLYEAGREGEKAVQVKYNRDGTVAEKIDREGRVTRYAYDGRGLLTREITPLGEERYYYDAAERLVKHETASRNSVTYYTEWTYNDPQRTVTVTKGGLYTETLYLNAWGEVTRQVDGEGNERRYEYDGAGNIKKMIDGYGRASAYEWNGLGKLSAVTFADGTGERYEYDHTGNLTAIRDSIGVSWAGEYDTALRLSKETGRPGINKEYRYDVLGRVVEVKNGGEVTEQYRYTNRGRETVFIDGSGGEFTRRDNPYGEPVNETNRLGDSRSFAYDAESRITGNTAYSGKKTRTEYSDAEGKITTIYSDGTQSVIEQDLSGNIVRITNETGTIRYRYDAGGKLIEQNDEGAGEITRYSYDKAGRRLRMVSGNRDVNYRYGRNGELLHVSDNSQRLEVTFEYDVLGQETRRVYGNGVRQETFYDAAGRVVLIKETDSRNQLLRAEGYLYDASGRRSHSVDGEGLVTKYEYDGQSRLSVVLYPWTAEKTGADRKEAEEAGLYFTPDKGAGERYTFSGTELNALREILNRAGPSRGNAVAGNQLVWREAYTYDRNGNRASKTTPWGTIKYEYDAENKLVKNGDIEYISDKDGNILMEKGARYEANYLYNGQDRMVYSEVINHVDRTHVARMYDYDALGRRTLTESITGERIRTIYDGKGFEVIREGETFRDGSLTTRYAPSDPSANVSSNQATGERYRWVSDGTSTRTRSIEGYTIAESRYGGRGVTLYGNGEAVAVSHSSSAGSRSMYLGKDTLGSVRSVTVDTGIVEGRYEYDAFGQPYKGDLSGGMNLGYTGKPYDTTTGLYNYGYRDYKPQAARFTTLDPIRDGRNWFAYVNNDPVNWVDLWGLWGQATQMAVERNNNQQYNKGNDCDIWVEKVLKEAGVPLPENWSPAAGSDVEKHIAEMKDDLQNTLSPGLNLVFHNNDHVMLVYLNDSGKVDLAQCTKNPEPENLIYEGYGNSENYSYKNIADFEADWKTSVKPTYYVPLPENIDTSYSKFQRICAK